MRFRKLRIAFSAVCGLVCLLLIVLWVKSYWIADTLCFEISSKTYLSGTTILGQFSVLLEIIQSTETSINVGTGPITIDAYLAQSPPNKPTLGWYSFPSPYVYRVGLDWPELEFDIIQDDDCVLVVVPQWFIVFLSATLSAVPWIRWRFSLRTLLIGMTLVAALLGAVVWAVR